jgi:hypothetical protein
MTFLHKCVVNLMELHKGLKKNWHFDKNVNEIIKKPGQSATQFYCRFRPLVDGRTVKWNEACTSGTVSFHILIPPWPCTKQSVSRDGSSIRSTFYLFLIGAVGMCGSRTIQQRAWNVIARNYISLVHLEEEHWGLACFLVCLFIGQKGRSKLSRPQQLKVFLDLAWIRVNIAQQSSW